MTSLFFFSYFFNSSHAQYSFLKLSNPFANLALPRTNVALIKILQPEKFSDFPARDLIEISNLTDYSRVIDALSNAFSLSLSLWKTVFSSICARGSQTAASSLSLSLSTLREHHPSRFGSGRKILPTASRHRVTLVRFVIRSRASFELVKPRGSCS